MIPIPSKFSWTKKEEVFFAILVLIGAVTFIWGLQEDSYRAWSNFLIDFFFWTSLSLAGVFFTALQYMSGSRWSATVRRVAEVFIGFLPVALVLYLIFYKFGYHLLYEWTHHHVVEEDKILSGKAPYLNETFSLIRILALFAVTYFLGGKIIRNSEKQDETGDASLTLKNSRLAAPFLVLFGWLFTFMSVDLIKSLEPHWFSTIFGVYCWAGLFSSGLAMLILWSIFLKRRGPLDVYLSADHLHDLGKLLFAFIIFWAYSAFSQYMLIWYSNLPEETFFFIKRQAGDWKNIGILLMVGKFGFPFLFLIGRTIKRNENALIFICIWYLIMQWVDLYWLVFPVFFKNTPFGWMEIGTFLGFLGLFYWSVGRHLSKRLPVAIKDPWIKTALHHHQ